MLDLITDVMVLDVDVFSSTMIHRVLRHLDSRLVVFANDEVWYWFICRSQNLA